MKIGTTTFAFRYLFLDAARSPEMQVIFDKAHQHGLNTLQVCENARPMDTPERVWTTAVKHAAGLDLEIQLGCKTTSIEVFRSYVDRAAVLPSRLLRLVFEEDTGAPPRRSAIARFLSAALPVLEERGVRLAIENHFDVSSQVLAEEVRPCPESLVGFCIDTANSLRNFESPSQVLDLLGSRALCYHVKDFDVAGDQLGFRVFGAPLGAGRLDLDGVLDRAFAHDVSPSLFVENWVPSTGRWDDDVRADDIWLGQSLNALRSALARRAHS